MLLLRTTGLEHVVPIVRDNLELIALYRQIKSNLGRNEEYRIFAEPSIDRFKKQISWYTEYEEEFSPLRAVFASCSLQVQDEIKSALKEKIDTVLAHFNPDNGVKNPDYVAFYQLLLQCIEIPSLEDCVYMSRLADGTLHFVLTEWGVLSNTSNAEMGIIQKIRPLRNVMIDCIYTDGTPASQVLLHFKQGERTWKAMTDGNGKCNFSLPVGTSFEAYDVREEGKQRFLKGFNVLDHAKYQLVLEAEDKPMPPPVPPVPPKQGTPPPVPPLGVKQPAEAPLPHNRKTVHVMNHLNEVLTGVPVHVWGEGFNLRTTTDENGNFYLHDIWGTKKVKMKIGDAPGKLKIVPDADYYQMTDYPKKKRPWWLGLLGILLLLLLLWLLRDCSCSCQRPTGVPVLPDSTVTHRETVPAPPDSLAEPPRDTVLRGERGSLRINLQWGSTDDLDLLVINPCSDTIYYKRKRQVCGGCTGTLDVDANAKPEMAIANPQENIFFDELPRGEIQVGVQMYNKRVSNTCPFRITIQAHNFEQVIDTVLVFDRLRENMIIFTKKFD